jgi:hypothetical protein
MMPVESRSDDTLSLRYEALRAQALGGCRRSGNPMGLALLMRQGLPAWMHAWSAVATVPGGSLPRLETQEPATAGQSHEVELVMVLASMVLKNRVEVIA